MKVHVGSRATLLTGCDKPVARRWWVAWVETSYTAYGTHSEIRASRKTVNCPGCLLALATEARVRRKMEKTATEAFGALPIAPRRRRARLNAADLAAEVVRIIDIAHKTGCWGPLEDLRAQLHPKHLCLPHRASGDERAKP